MRNKKNARERTPRKTNKLTDKDLSSEERVRKYIRKKQAGERKKRQKEVEVRERVASLLLDKLVATRTKKSTYIIIALDKEIKRLRRRGQGFRPKELKKLAHIEKKAVTYLMSAFNDMYKQKNIRKYKSVEPDIREALPEKVIDINTIQQRKDRYKQHHRKRAVNKVLEFLDRTDTDPIKALLVFMSDAGIKEIPTDLFFDEDHDFIDIVFELLVDNNDLESLPIRKYQKIAIGKA